MSTPGTTSTPLTLSTQSNPPLRQSTPPPQPTEHSVALTILQTVQHHQFASLDEASASLRSVSPEDRFDVVPEQAAKRVEVHHKGVTYRQYLENFAKNNEAFSTGMERA